MQANLEQFIEKSVSLEVKQEGTTFESLEQAHAHKEQKSREIRQRMEENSKKVIEGLRILSKQGTGFVVDVSTRLLNNLQSPSEFKKIVESELIANEHAFSLFSDAVNSFYDCNDYHLEHCVVAAFMSFFPKQPQPYACYATLIWREEGIAAAVAFYEQLVASVEEPFLDYFAAECFFKAGNHAEANLLIERALNKTHAEPHEHEAVRQKLIALGAKFN